MLQVGEDAEVDVEHVLFGPYGFTSLCGVGVIMPGRSECQRNLIFIIVALVVATHADEETHLIVLQFSVIFHRIGMNKHLQMLVVTEVHVHGFIDGTCISCGKVLHGQCQCLLIVLRQLWL